MRVKRRAFDGVQFLHAPDRTVQRAANQTRFRVERRQKPDAVKDVSIRERSQRFERVAGQDGCRFREDVLNRYDQATGRPSLNFRRKPFFSRPKLRGTERFRQAITYLPRSDRNDYYDCYDRLRMRFFPILSMRFFFMQSRFAT